MRHHDDKRSACEITLETARAHAKQARSQASAPVLRAWQRWIRRRRSPCKGREEQPPFGCGQLYHGRLVCASSEQRVRVARPFPGQSLLLLGLDHLCFLRVRLTAMRPAPARSTATSNHTRSRAPSPLPPAFSHIAEKKPTPALQPHIANAPSCVRVESHRSPPGYCGRQRARGLQHARR